MVNYVYLGYGKTNSSGVATLDHDADGNAISSSYTSVGAGRVDFVASTCNSSQMSTSGCSIQSEVYELWDTWKYDNGTQLDHNDIWTTNNANVNRSTEYSEIIETTSGTDGYAYTTVPKTCTMEFEVMQVDGGNTSFMQFTSSGNGGRGTISIGNCGGTVGNWVKVRLEVDPYHVVITNLESGYTQTNNIGNVDVARFRLRTLNEITKVRFKNFKIYNSQTTLVVTSANNTVEAEDTITMTAILTDKDNAPLIGKTVKLYKGTNTLVGTMTDNNDGTYSYTYTGTGAGLTSFYVKYGSLQSETYELMDASFYDRGTSSDYSDWTASDFTGSYLVRGDDYTTLTPSDNFDSQYQTISNTDTCFELDCCIDYTASSAVFSFRDNATSIVSFGLGTLRLTSGTWYHLKFVISNGMITPYVDDVAKTGKTLSEQINRFYIVLSNASTSSLKYKNFMIYPI